MTATAEGSLPWQGCSRSGSCLRRDGAGTGCGVRGAGCRVRGAGRWVRGAGCAVQAQYPASADRAPGESADVGGSRGCPRAGGAARCCRRPVRRRQSLQSFGAQRVAARGQACEQILSAYLNSSAKYGCWSFSFKRAAQTASLT